MLRYVSMYVSHCLCTKIQHRLLSRKLPIPEEHWNIISIDFILELLESGGYNSIMVAIDSAGKCSHFVETVTTVSPLLERQTFIFRTSGNSTASCGKSCPTADHNLSLPS